MKVRLVHRKTSTFHDFPYTTPRRKCIHSWIVNVTPPGIDHCIHRCAYCYARDAVFARDSQGVLEVYDNLPELVARDLERIALCPPISISNTTDPCQAVPEVRREVRRLVALLLARGVSFLIVTKGDATFLLDLPGFAEHSRCMVATTIEGPPEVLSLLAPAAPSFEARLASVCRVAAAGVFAAVRLDPVLPPVYEALYGPGWFKRVEGLLRDFAGASCRHVIASTGRLSRRPARGQSESSLGRLTRLAAGVDTRAAEGFSREYVYDRTGTSVGHLWRREARLEFHRRARAVCESLGMTYATCQETAPGEVDSAGIRHCEGGDLPFCRKGLNGRFHPIAGCTSQCHVTCRGTALPPCGRRDLVSPSPLRLSQLR